MKFQTYILPFILLAVVGGLVFDVLNWQMTGAACTVIGIIGFLASSMLAYLEGEFD